jgi:hypothetical protein
LIGRGQPSPDGHPSLKVGVLGKNVPLAGGRHARPTSIITEEASDHCLCL